MTPRFITLDELLRMHRDLIEDHGGSLGQRDPGLLDSALATPRAVFGGTSLTSIFSRWRRPTCSIS